MTGERLGAIIGAGFGAAFVLINAGELPPPWPLLIWLLGLGMTAASLRLIIVSQSSRTGARPPRSALRVRARSGPRLHKICRPVYYSSHGIQRGPDKGSARRVHA